jgi:hypothetical protein
MTVLMFDTGKMVLYKERWLEQLVQLFILTLVFIKIIPKELLVLLLVQWVNPVVQVHLDHPDQVDQAELVDQTVPLVTMVITDQADQAELVVQVDQAEQVVQADQVVPVVLLDRKDHKVVKV